MKIIDFSRVVKGHTYLINRIRCPPDCFVHLFLRKLFSDLLIRLDHIKRKRFGILAIFLLNVFCVDVQLMPE